MTLNPLLLSRLQFAWVIGWHILLPAFTIGRAAYVAFLEGAWFITGRAIWLRSCAVASPSTVGLVATINSRTSPSARRAPSKSSPSSLGPRPSRGESRPSRTK